MSPLPTRVSGGRGMLRVGTSLRKGSGALGSLLRILASVMVDSQFLLGRLTRTQYLHWTGIVRLGFIFYMGYLRNYLPF